MARGAPEPSPGATDTSSSSSGPVEAQARKAPEVHHKHGGAEGAGGVVDARRALAIAQAQRANHNRRIVKNKGNHDASRGVVDKEQAFKARMQKTANLLKRWEEAMERMELELITTSDDLLDANDDAASISSEEEEERAIRRLLMRAFISVAQIAHERRSNVLEIQQMQLRAREMSDSLMQKPLFDLVLITIVNAWRQLARRGAKRRRKVFMLKQANRPPMRARRRVATPTEAEILRKQQSRALRKAGSKRGMDIDVPLLAATDEPTPTSSSTRQLKVPATGWANKLSKVAIADINALQAKFDREDPTSLRARSTRFAEGLFAPFESKERLCAELGIDPSDLQRHGWKNHVMQNLSNGDELGRDKRLSAQQSPAIGKSKGEAAGSCLPERDGSLEGEEELFAPCTPYEPSAPRASTEEKAWRLSTDCTSSATGTRRRSRSRPSGTPAAVEARPVQRIPPVDEQRVSTFQEAFAISDKIRNYRGQNPFVKLESRAPARLRPGRPQSGGVAGRYGRGFREQLA